MNKITGKITLSSSNTAIPNLLVVIYDVDRNARIGEPPTNASVEGVPVVSNPFTIAEGSNPAQPSQAFPEGLGDRIGSVLTDVNGTFAIEYEDVEFRIRNEDEKRPDLLLMVLAPERQGIPTRNQILFISSEIRQNAGRIESYLIQLTAEQLQRAGLDISQLNTTDPTTVQARDTSSILEERLKRNKSDYERRRSLFSEYIAKEHKKHATKRTETFSLRAKKEISRVPISIRNSPYFVADGESVAAKTNKSIEAQVSNKINVSSDKKPTSTGFIYLTKEQIQRFQQYKEQGSEYYNLPQNITEQEILPNLFGGNNGSGPTNDFVMDHPAARLCQQIVKGEPVCTPKPESAPHKIEPCEDVNNTEPAPGTLAPTQPTDAALYIAKQMETVSSPEGPLNFGVNTNTRADAAQIGSTIADLQLRKGPADTPAYFDFHRMLIAFEHVWQEAMDAGILENAEALYDEVVGTGVASSNLTLLDILGNAKSSWNFVIAGGPPSNQRDDPPVYIIFEFPDVSKVWHILSHEERKTLHYLAIIILGRYTVRDNNNDGVKDAAPDWLSFLEADEIHYENSKTKNGVKVPYLNDEELLGAGKGYEVMAPLRSRGQRIIDNALERIEEKQEAKSDFDRFKKAAELADELKKKLKGRYSFTYFAANGTERSINYGVVLTYRQKWEPLNYQVGELVKTIPLAPKEVRKYSKKTVVKTTRSQKEMENNLQITKNDTSDTNRSESEIVEKAMKKNTFSMNNVAIFDIPLGGDAKIGNTLTTANTNDAQTDSSQTKKEFREAVIKTAQEYKNERKIEISTESFYESEITESGEISNPNDELTVTYLFYELQRQFRINERLHRMRPVIFVAQEMPAPHEIDDDWIITHDWVIRRALLDDSFLYAFDCVMSIRGDQLMLTELERTVQEQRKLIRDLRQNVKFYTDETGRLSRMMQAAINKEADIVEDRDIWDSIPLLGDRLDAVESAFKGVGKMLGMGAGDDPGEAARIRREAVKDTFERAERERRELMGRLERETGVLNALTREVAEKRKAINEKEVLIARLKNHLKDNILHYMQAIWSSEHRDQRFFRLFNTKVPALTAKPGSYNLKIKVTPSPSPIMEAVVNDGLDAEQQKVRHTYTFAPQVSLEEKTLAEVADLDTLLGFKGNYMIFPLRKSNVLTDFMMSPYVDSEFQLLDPDAPGNWTLEEYDQFYCCLKQSLGERFGEVEEDLKALYREILTNPLRPDEVITVPTGSLFIEALPGAHPILENFKALHRAVDVKKVQAEVRKMELENIRYAARIMEGQLDDPDTEKKVVIGNSNVDSNISISE